jgi:hypothetical protein
MSRNWEGEGGEGENLLLLSRALLLACFFLIIDDNDDDDYYYYYYGWDFLFSGFCGRVF